MIDEGKFIDLSIRRAENTGVNARGFFSIKEIDQYSCDTASWPTPMGDQDLDGPVWIRYAVEELG